MEKHLIVVSIDAMVYEDLEYASTLPAFKKIMDGSSMVKKVKTIYPSLTHPVHATLITGAPAGVTGTYSNELFDPFSLTESWFNNLGEIKCDTLIHAAKRAGLTVASASWPMVAHDGGLIDYHVPCALNCDFRGYEDEPLNVYRSLGASECVMGIIAEAVKRFGWENRHPEVDEFQTYCVKEIIKKFKPNLLLTHPSYVDSMRHRTGIFGEGVNEALRATDRWLGDILDAIRDAGIEDSTDIVLLSDHGQLGIVRRVCPNVLLRDAGYIDADENGRVTSWRAFAHSCGLSSQVHLCDPEDEKLKKEIYDLLTKLAEDKLYGFERVFTKEEVKERYGLDGDFSFVLETDGYSAFSSEVVRPIVRELDTSDYRYGKGTHGHMPEKGPQPTIVVKGPSFKSGVVIENGDILNHAPTFAKVLGVELRDARGAAIDELIK